MEVETSWDEMLKSCDVCWRTEADDIIDGMGHKLIPMNYDKQEGLWLCPGCEKKIKKERE